MGKREDAVLVQDILEAIRRIDEYAAGMTFQKFVRDGKTLDAVVRNFEIIGEAAKKFSPAFREARQFSGTRSPMIFLS